jgi:hypothetical protein
MARNVFSTGQSPGEKYYERNQRCEEANEGGSRKSKHGYPSRDTAVPLGLERRPVRIPLSAQPKNRDLARGLLCVAGRRMAPKRGDDWCGSCSGASQTSSMEARMVVPLTAPSRFGGGTGAARVLIVRITDCLPAWPPREPTSMQARVRLAPSRATSVPGSPGSAARSSGSRWSATF